MSEKAHPSHHAYVLRLRVAQPRRDDRLSGRLEHVASGRRFEFDNDAALLEWLHRERDLVQTEKPSLSQPTKTNP